MAEPPVTREPVAEIMVVLPAANGTDVARAVVSAAEVLGTTEPSVVGMFP